jgi:hypothetical protein
MKLHLRMTHQFVLRISHLKDLTDRSVKLTNLTVSFEGFVLEFWSQIVFCESSTLSYQLVLRIARVDPPPPPGESHSPPRLRKKIDVFVVIHWQLEGQRGHR